MMTAPSTDRPIEAPPPPSFPLWRALLGLSRWREHIPFTLAATVLGIDMAAEQHARVPDERAIIAILGAILAVTFAFMINDLEDAPDDARDPARRAQNVIASGALAPRPGWIVAGLVALTALLLFALLNPEAAACGALILALSWLYSWRPVRLKAWPLVDVVSHALMLSTLLFLTGYLALDPAPEQAWGVAIAVGFISAYGQLYNQGRDFAADRAAGLRNTAHVLGYRRTIRAMYACLIGAILILGWSVWLGLWPLWLVVLMALALPMLTRLRRRADMRGTTAIDLSGRLQVAAMIGANILVLCWFAVLLVR